MCHSMPQWPPPPRQHPLTMDLILHYKLGNRSNITLHQLLQILCPLLYMQGGYATHDSSGMYHLMPQWHLPEWQGQKKEELAFAHNTSSIPRLFETIIYWFVHKNVMFFFTKCWKPGANNQICWITKVSTHSKTFGHFCWKVIHFKAV